MADSASSFAPSDLSSSSTPAARPASWGPLPRPGQQATIHCGGFTATGLVVSLTTTCRADWEQSTTITVQLVSGAQVPVLPFQVGDVFEAPAPASPPDSPQAINPAGKTAGEVA